MGEGTEFIGTGLKTDSSLTFEEWVQAEDPCEETEKEGLVKTKTARVQEAQERKLADGTGHKKASLRRGKAEKAGPRSQGGEF